MSTLRLDYGDCIFNFHKYSENDIRLTSFRIARPGQQYVGGIGIGSPLADVIALMGNPNVASFGDADVTWSANNYFLQMVVDHKVASISVAEHL